MENSIPKTRTSFIYSFLFSLIVVFFTRPAFAQWSPAGNVQGISAGSASYQNLVIGANGRFYVSYYDVAVQKGSIQEYDGSVWSYLGGQGITPGFATYNSLGITSGGDLFYSHQGAYPNSEMYIMRYSAGNWSTGVQASSSTVNYQAMTIAVDDTPFVVHNGMHVLRFDGSAWVQVGNAAFAPSGASYADIVTGLGDSVYVAFVANGQVMVYRNHRHAGPADLWQPVGNASGIAGATDSSPFAISLAIDASGRLYIAYVLPSASGKRLSVRRYEGGQWNLLGQDGFSPAAAEYVSLAIAPSGTPYVAFSDAGVSGRASVMQFSGSAWVQTGSAGFSAGTAKWNALAIDSSGMPVLAFCDEGLGGKLAVMQYQPTFPAPYCDVSFQYNADGNMITRVQFAGIDNSSPFTSGTTPSAEDFLNISGTVMQGAAYPVSVKGPSSTFPSDVMVYIDWNQNLSFTDPGEAYYIGRLAAANPANAYTITDTVQVPAAALPGATRMRVLKNTNLAAYSDPNAANSITDACSATLRSGQFEDYTLIVQVSGSQPCIPSAAGPNPGDQGCVTFTYRGQTVYYPTVRAADGNIWLQQNLGAQSVAVAKNDSLAYGDLFQWGRWDDGHQLRTSVTGAAPIPNDPSGLGNGMPLFITGSGSLAWWGGTQQMSDTWAGTVPADASAVNGVDPCKVIGTDWRLPQQTEWADLLNAEQIQGPDAAFNSNLKLTVGGSRSSSSGGFDFTGTRGYYWSSTTSSTGGKYLYYSTAITNPSAGNLRGGGASVRCVQVIPQVQVIDSVKVRIQNNAAPQITLSGGTLQAEAQVFPANASQNVIWSIVPGSGMAFIDAAGLVTAQDNGTIWARAASTVDPSQADSVQITLSGQVTPVLSVTVSTLNNVPAEIMAPGATLQLLATVNPAVVNQAVLWSIVPGSGMAAVDAAGLVTAQADGTVWGRAASTDDPSKADSILIMISGQAQAALSLTVSTQNNVPPLISSAGATLQMEAQVLPLTADQQVQWSVVPATGSALISTSGLLNALSDGTVWARAVSVSTPSVSDSLLVNISGQDHTSGLPEGTETVFSLYPNPATEHIWIQCPGAEFIRLLRILDITGKVVAAERNIPAEAYSINISALPAGLYIADVYTQNGSGKIRFVKR